MSKQESYLVTGSMGCIGAWTLYHLVEKGKRAVGFDISDKRDRLNLLINPEDQKKIEYVKGDITSIEQLIDTLRKYNITHIIHLAALQIPHCKARPLQGARVNVVGHINVFEAARQENIRHIAYASSIAVYAPTKADSEGDLLHEASFDPHTLYGVYKVADEGIANVYWKEYQISSIGLRPYIVYGVGRDQGLTSDPTKAMLATAADEPAHIAFNGTMQFHFASDVALQFIQATRTMVEGACVFNMGTPLTPLAELVDIIKVLRPNANITLADTKLPFPAGFDDTDLKNVLGEVHQTPLKEGIKQTIEKFEACLADGRLHV